MTENELRRLKAGEIPAFVADVIAAGCDICAIGHESYVIGDVEEQDAARDELDRIAEKYGNRDPIRQQIVAYLWSIGRYVEVSYEVSITRH